MLERQQQQQNNQIFMALWKVKQPINNKKEINKNWKTNTFMYRETSFEL